MRVVLGCPHARTVYRSACAQARQVRGHGYGLDVVVRIGHLRFGEHRTRAEIWDRLRQEHGIVIWERHVQHLLEVYLALLQASGQDLLARLGPVAQAHGGLILSVDGVQPEHGNEQLWVVREVHSGASVAATNLQQASAPVLVALLQPVQATGLRVLGLLGLLSDAQESVRLAVAQVFPGVPHQLCQYHALREATEPLWEADRHLLVQVKQELRSLREVEERTRQRMAERQAAGESADPTDAVVLDSVLALRLALRQVVRERGTQPLEFGALRALDQLAALGDTLDRCLAKRGSLVSPACAPWSSVHERLEGRGPAICASPMPGCGSWLIA